MRTSSLTALAVALFFTVTLGAEISYAICVTHADCDDGIACTHPDICDPGNPAADPTTGCVISPQDAGCDDGVFCNGRERCDPGTGGCVAGTPAPCCSDPSSFPRICAEAFPRCNDDSLNAGAGCQSDRDCPQGRCERCQPSCNSDDDCDDGFRCNGTETCLRTCSGGPNNGNACMSNSNCTPGACIGQCQPGVGPCGDADCVERVCQNVVPTQPCRHDFECSPGVSCVDISPNPPGVTCFSGICSDGTISGSEECDPNANLPNSWFGQLPDGCFAGSTCRPDTDPFPCTCTPSCGNGNLELGEECDGFAGSACRGRCRVDCTCAPSSCGNGRLEDEVSEECEFGVCTTASGIRHCSNSPYDVCTSHGPCVPGFCLWADQCSVDAQCSAGTCDTTADRLDCATGNCLRPGDPTGECTCVCGFIEIDGYIDWNSDPLSPDRTTRSLKFRVQPPIAATGVSGTIAIQITPVDLEHPVPGYQPSANPLPKNFTTFDTRSNGTCSNGAHAGHHCDTVADCRLCGGVGANTNKPCTSDTDCPGGFCPTSVCTGDARRPCSNNGHCTGFGNCGAPITYACGGLAACTGEAAMSPTGVGGCARWVGKPERFREAQEVDLTPLDYLGARLQCTPYYHDWVTATATEKLTVFGAEILPNSTYSVVAYSSSCKGDEAGCLHVSAPVEMRTRRHGDVVSGYNPPLTTQQPDATDIGQLVAKFKKQPGSPSNNVSLIQPNIPDPNSDVGASDIVQGVDAAKQFVYSFGGPCPCPSLARCPPQPTALPCPNGAGDCIASGLPGLGPESTCIKLCRGGTNDGEQCNNHKHCGGGGVCDKECLGGTNVGKDCSSNSDCPGSTCAVVTNNAFCKDKCGRCTP